MATSSPTGSYFESSNSSGTSSPTPIYNKYILGERGISSISGTSSGITSPVSTVGSETIVHR